MPYFFTFLNQGKSHSKPLLARVVRTLVSTIILELPSSFLVAKNWELEGICDVVKMGSGISLSFHIAQISQQSPVKDSNEHNVRNSTCGDGRL